MAKAHAGNKPITTKNKNRFKPFFPATLSDTPCAAVAEIWPHGHQVDVRDNFSTIHARNDQPMALIELAHLHAPYVNKKNESRGGRIGQIGG